MRCPDADHQELDGVDLYYDPDLTENAYLAGGTYALAGGGDIVPPPEPSPYFAGAAPLILDLLHLVRLLGPGTHS